MPAMSRRRSDDEVDVVPLDALHGVARGLQDKHPSVWIDIDPKLFDPRRGTTCTTISSTSSVRRELWLRCRVRERAPRQRLRPDALAEPDRLQSRAFDVRRGAGILGNSVALYNPPTRVAEEMAMIDVISGGRMIAGFRSGARRTPVSPTARIRACCANGISRRSTSFAVPGPRNRSSPLTGASPSSAT